MKTYALSALALAISLTAQADTLGVPDGRFLGEGVLVSEHLLVPNLKFKSVRVLHHGTVMAHTRALFAGHGVAQAQARLKFHPRFAQKMAVLDMDNDYRKVGDASCNDRECSFSATVMGGKLTLKETWVRDGDGFKVINASQVYSGLNSRYEADFAPAF